ncbi:lipopolysaccharide biosynthesis protein [Anaerocolumna chitinilytica]|uniref:Polysaccharide biosynthesis protein n=1 Tax=Anaerocolumna chitinilytica TaxID=1727145 RepID=A0A7I8DUM1_9FIRM|nr:oligosaccharide flippase family protein [Anaerocolumna chitinilytica]BCK00816.1 polysaccharide biosynthesis protein [Anaerocolumna chitinilytica]
MNKLTRFIKTSGVYFIGNVLSKLISFILLPLYTYKISPEQYGEFDVIITIMNFLIPILFFQIWDGMFRFTFDKKKEKDKYVIVSNSLFISFIGILLCSVSIVIFYHVFPFKNVWLVFFYGISFALQYHYSYIARAFLKNNLFVFTGFINSLLSAFFNIILILYFHMGIESLYISPIIGCFVQIFIIEISLNPLKNLNIKVLDFKLIKEMLRFSIPLCIATISYWLLSGYTKVVISKQLGTYENGLYAVANKFSVMISLIISVFQYAWNEMAYSMAADDNRIDSYRKSIQYILQIVLLGSGIFMLFTKIVFPYFVNASYKDALLIVPLSIIGVAINSFAGFLGTIFMTEKQTRYILWTTIISAIVNLIGSFFIVAAWGLQGAIGTLCFAFIVLAFMRLRALEALFHFKLSKKNIIYILLLIVSVYLYYSFTNPFALIICIVVYSIILLYSLKDIIHPFLYNYWRKVGIKK